MPSPRAWPGTIWRAAAALAGALALASAFPPGQSMVAAWFGFVPLLLIARFTAPRRAFMWGFIAGWIFWLVTLSWLLSMIAFNDGVTAIGVVLGWMILSAYCALYHGAFLLLAAWAFEAARLKPAAPDAPRPGLAVRLGFEMLVPLLWVGLEYLRSILLTGFAWNALGISQFRNITIIQVAEWGGVYAVSFIVMLVNTALALTVLQMAASLRQRAPARRWHPELMVGLLVCAFCMVAGVRRVQQLGRETAGSVPVRLAAVQLNIPQTDKWDENEGQAIYDRIEMLVGRVQMGRPDLVILPETAIPGWLTQEPRCYEWLASLAAQGAPILTGAMGVEGVPAAPKYFNSSFLMMPDGTLAGEYRKQHLVVFGEYVPMDKVFTSLQGLCPLGLSCTPGTAATVFRLPVAAATNRPVAFSTLICFEDAMPYLARRAVRAGARFLVNQTNDGWFEKSAAALQHLSHSVFRCVENRVPAVRCANMGISGFIDRTGMLDPVTLELLKSGQSATAEYRMDQLLVPPAAEPAFYTRHGDRVFALPCGILAAMLLSGWMVKQYRNKRDGS
jgi:apolipoprotein N-acyltransferase